MITQEAPHWITPEIEEMIMQAKRSWPNSFRLKTIEKEWGLVLLIVTSHFEEFTIPDKIKIAEGVNELCERIRTTGCVAQVWKM